MMQNKHFVEVITVEAYVSATTLMLKTWSKHSRNNKRGKDNYFGNLYYSF